MSSTVSRTSLEFSTTRNFCCQFLSGNCFVFQSLHTSSGILSHASDGSPVKAVHVASYIPANENLHIRLLQNFILVPSCDFTPHSSSKQNALPAPIIPTHTCRRGFEQVLTFTTENSFDEWFTGRSFGGSEDE